MAAIQLTVSAILFDSDGTLIDSTPAVRATISRWCAAQGVDPRAFAAAQHGTRAKDLLRRFAARPKRGCEMSEEELDAAVEELESEVGRTAAGMASEGERGIVMLPGVERMLEKLREGRANWGVVTSATRTHACAALDAAGVTLSSLPVPVLVTGDLVKEGKPHAEPYLAGKLQPSLEAKGVLVIEDAPAGLQSGDAAGCRVLAVCTGPVAAVDVVQAAADIEGAIVARDLSRCAGSSRLSRVRAS
ncbi:uncharacterized protein RHOBADRAFT_13536 [Rhodotorula graminis WP1]|uniref:Uncharacterized protein n=1 Tax=Rhodotorula graminis (strain WP1) TaxID=578459 RepID=A0A194S6Z5_RHOGW|nr:uncharacterized protein RHOBADRAFT_13536 [Rhodotorula graminis WP1]KPV76493.1 hypothetical protein RHOBADRAFT_13536 [Rhodotorula graminis WP1]